MLPWNKWIKLSITGINVIHSFGLSTLGLKFDGIPGRLNSLYFQFTRLGFYRGQCYEFCGLLHYGMPIKLLATEFSVDGVKNGLRPIQVKPNNP